MMLLISLALASRPIEIFVEVPALATTPATYTEEDDSGALVWTDPRFHLRLGLGGAVRAISVAGGGLMVDGGVNLWSAVWPHEPEEFGVAIWEEWLGCAWRWEPSHPEAAVQGWWEAGGGLYVQEVLPTWFSGIIVVTPGAWTGGGFMFGKGSVRPTLAMRAGFVHPGGNAQGATSNTPDDFAWTWNAGRAYVDAQIGVVFY